MLVLTSVRLSIIRQRRGLRSDFTNLRIRTMTSLSSAPTLALVPPGQCQFGDDFQSVPLLERNRVSPTSSVLRFGLPDSSKPLNLSTCACILAKADLPDREGILEPVVRPYTPISTNRDVGHFDLLIKDYGEQGRLSTYLTEQLPIGESLAFKHISFNVKIQAPFQQTHIGMLVGGTGITPMIQALHAILGDPASTTRATMLYGSRVSGDILGHELLDQWSSTSDASNRLSVTHVLSHEPDDSEWKGARGHIDRELLGKHMPSPDDKDGIIFVCGPPPMYDALCGPRDSQDVSGLLGEMGYTTEQVFKF